GPAHGTWSEPAGVKRPSSKYVSAMRQAPFSIFCLQWRHCARPEGGRPAPRAGVRRLAGRGPGAAPCREPLLPWRRAPRGTTPAASSPRTRRATTGTTRPRRRDWAGFLRSAARPRRSSRRSRGTWRGPSALARSRGAWLLQPAQHEALQIIRLRHAQHDRVIAGLAALLDHGDHGGRVRRRVGQDRLEVVLVDVVRARAGDEAASRPEDPQRAPVDLLVAARRLGDRVTALGEGGRVEDHGVEALLALVELVQQVEDVGVTRLDVPEAVALGVRLHAREGLAREVDRDHRLRVARDLQREAAVVAEGVEHAPLRVAACRQAVLALREEE